MIELDGPHIVPRSGNAKQLVIVLHGYGDSGSGILGLAHEWMADMPDTAFVAPNAVAPCEVFPSGYQWFPIRANQSIEAKQFDRKELIQEPAEALDAFIDKQLLKWGVDDSKLAVVGFSQGAMMAMYAMPRRKKACAGIIGYSGMLVDAAGLKTGTVKIPVLAVHGAEDEVVPPACLAAADEGFTSAGFDIETILRPYLGHSIDAFGLKRGLDFMLECFDKK